MTEAIYGGAAVLKRWRWGLPRNIAFSGLNNDRLQVELGRVFWLVKHLDAAQRVLLADGQTGFEVEPLWVAGASSVWCRIADRAQLKYAQRNHSSERVVFSDQLPSAESKSFDLVVADLEKLVAPDRNSLLPLVARNSRLVVGWGASSTYGDQAWARARQWLLEHFLTVTELVALPPEGYQPDFSSASPARARGQEYRYVESSLGKENMDRIVGGALVASSARRTFSSRRLRLHVGSGTEHLPDWVNIDIQALPGVDLTLDVSRKLDFENVEVIFAEHFLEHLTITQAFSFLVLAYWALGDDGRLRITTPSLEYVLQTHYPPQCRRGADLDSAIHAAIQINRAFHGWGHQFLWNAEVLEWVLTSCGFRDIEWLRRGESRFEALRHIERHEEYADDPDQPHVLVVEASKGDWIEERVNEARQMLEQAFM